MPGLWDILQPYAQAVQGAMRPIRDPRWGDIPLAGAAVRHFSPGAADTPLPGGPILNAPLGAAGTEVAMAQVLGELFGGTLAGGMAALRGATTPEPANPSLFQHAQATRNADIKRAFAEGGPLAAYRTAMTEGVMPGLPGTPTSEFGIPVGKFNPVMDPRGQVQALGLALNPTNAVGGPLGEAGRALEGVRGAAGLGRGIQRADTAISEGFSAPVSALLARLARPATQAREAELLSQLRAAGDTAGNVPRSQGPLGPAVLDEMRTPGVPGNVPKADLRAAGGYGPKLSDIPPPAFGARGMRAELPEPPAPVPGFGARGSGVEAPDIPAPAVLQAAERAAPPTREAALAGFSGKDTNTLLGLAYDHPKAVANAQAKYADPLALRDRAIERIQADAGRVERLGQLDPDLAARVAALPERGAEAAPVSAFPPGETAALGASEGATGALQEAMPVVEQAPPVVPEATPVAEAVPTTPAARRVAPPEVRDARAALKQAEADMAAVRNRPVSGDAEYLDKLRDEAIARGKYNAARGAATRAETRWRNGVFDRGGTPGAPLVLPGGQIGADAAQAIWSRVEGTLAGMGLSPDYLPYVRQRWQEAMEAAASGGPNARARLGWSSFWDQWARGIVTTIHNAGQDKVFRDVIVREFGPAGAAKETETLARELMDAPGQLPASVQRRMDALGASDYAPQVGSSLLQDVTKPGGQYLPPAQRAMVGAAQAMFRPREHTIPIVGPLISGALRGRYQPGIDAAFQAAQAVTHGSGRYGLFDLALDRGMAAAGRDFLGELRARGVDTTTLDAKAGYFSPDEVAGLAGASGGDADRWRQAVAATVAGAEALPLRVFGDYSTMNAVDRTLGRVLPFSRWAVRTAPVAAEIAARHPGATAAYVAAVRQDAADAARAGRPPWQVGTIPTPLGRLNPAQLFSPVGPEAASLGAGDQPEQVYDNPVQQAYQQGKQALSTLGLSVHPAAQALAYATGLDYSRPGNLSRYAGLEGPPVGPEIGSPAQAALDTARKWITGQTPPPTPLDRQIAADYFRAHNVPLSQATDAASVLETFPGGPIYELARREVAGGQAGQAALSALSPVTFQREDPLSQAATVAKGGLPFAQAEITTARQAGDKPRVAAMLQANDQAKAANPTAAIYDGASVEGRKRIVTAMWERQMLNWDEGSGKRALREQFSRALDQFAGGALPDAPWDQPTYGGPPQPPAAYPLPLQGGGGGVLNFGAGR